MRSKNSWNKEYESKVDKNGKKWEKKLDKKVNKKVHYKYDVNNPFDIRLGKNLRYLGHDIFTFGL